MKLIRIALKCRGPLVAPLWDTSRRRWTAALGMPLRLGVAELQLVMCQGTLGVANLQPVKLDRIALTSLGPHVAPLWDTYKRRAP